MTHSTAFLVCILLIGLLCASVESHGFLKSPRSRNYYASVEGADWGGGVGVPPKEYCPHCLNAKSADQVCGTGQAQNYDKWTDTSGNAMPWMSQGTYTEGQEISIEAVLTTNHAGHFDVFVCPDGDDSTQDCFLDNPLTFVKDVLHNGPFDEDYPERAYVAPATNFRFIYRLPMGVHGSKVMLQWRYVTANSCFPPGYERTELGLRARGWLRSEGMYDCSWPLNWTGERDDTNPEQFWNCAEITVLPASPTKSPTPTINILETQKPVSAPVQAPSPQIDGCCTWNGGESCGPTWCNDSKSNCEGSCAGTYIGNPSPSAPSPTAPTPTPPAPTNPTPPTPPTSGTKIATTTRYWDCSGGACGCAYLPFGPGSDSRPAHCYSNAMFEAPANNPHGAKFYGTAAISQGLGGGNWMAEGCGKCWRLRGWSNIAGKDVFQTTLVLKGTNFCPPENPACSGEKAHFDIAAPGFDVLQYSFANTCEEREEDEISGFKACGRWMIDSQDPDVGCNCSEFFNPVLRAGCENFFSLLWDNAKVDYEEVECPVELSRLNCWEENGGKYPEDTPQFCASNVGENAPSPPTPTPPTPTPPTPTPPTPTPPTSSCSDTEQKFMFRKKMRGCGWVKLNQDARCRIPVIAKKCPDTCETCNCVDSRRKFKVNGVFTKCNLIRKNYLTECSTWKARKKCPVSCRTCESSNPTKSPVQSPTPGVGDYCCSDDLKTCKVDEWCNASETNCAGCSARWILKNPDCELAWWDDCMGNPNGCCPPATCEDFGTWAQCRA